MLLRYAIIRVVTIPKFFNVSEKKSIFRHLFCLSSLPKDTPNSDFTNVLYTQV